MLDQTISSSTVITMEHDVSTTLVVYSHKGIVVEPSTYVSSLDADCPILIIVTIAIVD